MSFFGGTVSGGGGLPREGEVQIRRWQEKGDQFRGEGPVVTEDRLGKVAAFSADTETQALLRQGALEVLDGKLGTLRNRLHLGKLGVQIPLRSQGVVDHAVGFRDLLKGR